jgi:hypothetical protein
MQDIRDLIRLPGPDWWLETTMSNGLFKKTPDGGKAADIILL